MSIKGLNKATAGGIDYLYLAESIIGRGGYSLNICTGCKHYMTAICSIPCYARELVVNGRLKDSPSYPYGFEPTYHPERVQAIGGNPKLIFLNDMGDVGGAWNWKRTKFSTEGIYKSSESVANAMVRFALLNPQHILLLLTKRPEWYALAEWPANVMCGFTATNNQELDQRRAAMADFTEYSRTWYSLEPWLDSEAPKIIASEAWLVIGGLSGRNPRPVSEATWKWILDDSIQAKRFIKTNARTGIIGQREYPVAWTVTP